MDLIFLLKQSAEIGLSPPAIIGIIFLFKINNRFSRLDNRISVVEAKQEMIVSKVTEL